jgi:hypothetical protein
VKLLRRLAVGTLLVALVVLRAPARAAESPALYQATAIVTGTDMRERPSGFARCLTEVLVKLSGAPRLRDDPAVAALASRAEALVDSFTYVDPRAGLLHHDDQGTYDRSYELTVRFNPAKVEAALVRLGATVWHGPRPLLVPVILVRSRDPTPFLLSADTPRGVELRAAIVRLAGEYGVGVHFPTEADLAAWSVGLIGFPAPLGTPDPAQVQISGSLSWNVQAGGWIGIWRMPLDDKEHEWQISGVGFDQAFADMVSGAVMLAAGTGFR